MVRASQGLPKRSERQLETRRSASAGSLDYLPPSAFAIRSTMSSAEDGRGAGRGRREWGRRAPGPLSLFPLQTGRCGGWIIRKDKLWHAFVARNGIVLSQSH